MSSDDGTTKSKPIPPAAGTPGAAKPKPEGGTPSKPEGSAPSSYSRGEGQKPVTNAYKENWNRIYGKKKTKRSK